MFTEPLPLNALPGDVRTLLIKITDKAFFSSEEGAIIFERGMDPGTGYLRIVGDLAKIEKNNRDPAREISLKEIYQVVFGKGRSTCFKEYNHESCYEGKITRVRQFQIVGLTDAGSPVLVVIEPRDRYGLAKRIVTSWRVGCSSKYVKKLLRDCPHLKGEIKKHV